MFKESALKGYHLIELCTQLNIPLVFLQNTLQGLWYAIQHFCCSHQVFSLFFYFCSLHLFMKAENGDVVKSKMEDYQVIEQIGRGAFEAAFLVLHKFETRRLLLRKRLKECRLLVWWVISSSRTLLPFLSAEDQL